MSKLAEWNRKKRAVEFVEGSPLDIADQLITELEATVALLTADNLRRIEELKQATKDRDHEHNKLMDTASELAEARAEAKALHDYAQAQIDEANELRAEVERQRHANEALLRLDEAKTARWRGRKYDSR